MNWIRTLLREQAQIVDAFETLLVLFVSLGLDLTREQQAYSVAALIGGFGVLKALLVRPWAVSVFVDETRAVLVLVASFGLTIHGRPLDENMIAVIATAVGSLLTLILRAQVTPKSDPRPLSGEVQQFPHAA